MFFKSRSQPLEPLELRFGVASPRLQTKSQQTAATKLIHNLEDEFATPQLLLREALFQTHGINRANLSSARRLKLCIRIQQRVWSTLSATRDELRKSSEGVPEPAPQQEQLDLSDQLITALTLGYQIVIEMDYRPDDRHSRTEHRRILEACVHTLELLHLQQRLRALRYQPLAGSAWQVANIVFCVLSRAGQLDAPIAAITDDRLLVDAVGSTRPTQLYTAIQAFGLFDALSWGKRQQRFLDTYCAALPDALEISYAPRQIAGRAIRFSHAYQNGPPSETSPSNTTHRIVIDFTALTDAANADKDACKLRDAQASGTLSAILAGLPPLARLPTMRTMLRSLEHTRSSFLPDPAEVHDCNLRLETGMEQVKRHLQAVFTSDATLKEHMLGSGAFSGRSATMGDDTKHTGGTAWKVLRQSAHHMLVHTRETRYTKQIAVGTLVVYGIGEEGFARPQIGTVRRITRPESESLYVEIKQLARFATLVNIVAGIADEDTHSKQIPCLMAYDDGVGWCIISSQQNSLPIGYPIKIQTRRLQINTRLRKLREITPHFQMFQLDAQDPEPGVPNYPSPRKRQRISNLVMTSQMITVSQPNAEPSEDDSEAS